MLTSLILTSIFAPTSTPLDSCSASKATTAANHLVQVEDIVDTAVAAGSFNTLAAALKAGELVEALKGEGPFTVFAPTDDAFAALPEGTLANLLKPENKATLQAILTYHVVSGEVPAAKVVEMKNATTLNGQRVDIKVGDGGVTVDGAAVTTTDIRCSNGIIHVIDSVILPNTNDIVATAVEAGQFKTLGAALKAAGLVEALRGEGPFTVFAPTDRAFEALPEGAVANLLKPENRDKLAAVLKFHVVKGRVFSEAAAAGAKVATLQGSELETGSRDGGVFVGSAMVVKADIETANGVIHVIDSVLMPH